MATNDDLTLIGAWLSQFVVRVRIALNIKGLDFNFQEEKYGTKSKLLLKSNPVHKKMPVLIHQGKPICESLVIVHYIDELWSSSGHLILPSYPYDRAIARFWSAYVDQWFPKMRGIVTASDQEGKKVAVEQVVAGLVLLEEAFDSCSKGKSFFGGDHIGLLDIALGSVLGWIRAAELSFGFKLIDHANTPKLAEWADKFYSDPAVAPIMPDTEKLVEFAKTHFYEHKEAQPSK